MEEIDAEREAGEEGGNFKPSLLLFWLRKEFEPIDFKKEIEKRKGEEGGKSALTSLTGAKLLKPSKKGRGILHEGEIDGGKVDDENSEGETERSDKPSTKGEFRRPVFTEETAVEIEGDVGEPVGKSSVHIVTFADDGFNDVNENGEDEEEESNVSGGFFGVRGG